MIARLLALSLVLSGMFAHAGGFVELRYGESSATVATDGARVLSLRLDGREVLWQPSQWLFPGGKGSHGGIFICWPWFGSDGPKEHARHGFAREHVFSVREKERNGLFLGLAANDRTKEIFPHDFDLEVGFSLTTRLSVTLRTRNLGDDAFEFGGGFHPYLAVGNRDDAVVKGINGLPCANGTDEMLPWKGDLRVTSACDSLFSESRTVGSYEVVDAVLSRCIGLVSYGTNRLVVWNPGMIGDAADTPGAIGPDGWRRFICVEPVLTGDGKIRLKPGDRHQMSLELRVLPMQKIYDNKTLLRTPAEGCGRSGGDYELKELPLSSAVKIASKPPLAEMR